MRVPRRPAEGKSAKIPPITGLAQALVPAKRDVLGYPSLGRKWSAARNPRRCSPYECLRRRGGVAGPPRTASPGVAVGNHLRHDRDCRWRNATHIERIVHPEMRQKHG